MPTKAECAKKAAEFRGKNGIEASDENLIAAIHLVNQHAMNPEMALTQTSFCGNDHGIDAWYYREQPEPTLFIYQSKLTPNKTQVLKGLKDLSLAMDWLSQALIGGKLDEVPGNNPVLFNLHVKLAAIRPSLKRVWLTLLSPSDGQLVGKEAEIETLKAEIIRSPLYNFLSGKLDVRFAEYRIEEIGETDPPPCLLPLSPDPRLELRPGVNLQIAYIPLHTFVDLYRQRGDMLFEKNVRLSLSKLKSAKHKLANPMLSTLEQIAESKADPHLFALYHVGITVSALKSSQGEGNSIELYSPNVINGCQTITLAAEFLRKLEKQKNKDREIENFKKIQVVVKLVLGASDEETKEITNANNRQTPIEDWQLFSNEPVHIDLANRLKVDVGVLYERQRGKLDTLKDVQIAKDYYNTNATSIKVAELAQIVALVKGEIDYAVQPSKIFFNSATHQRFFNDSLTSAQEIVFLWNAFKSVKRGLQKHLNLPHLVDSDAGQIFSKPSLRMNTYRLALLHLVKVRHKHFDGDEFSAKLCKNASKNLTRVAEEFYPKIVPSIKHWYKGESKNLTQTVTASEMKQFFADLTIKHNLTAAQNSLPFAA